ncbi:hypothetical protein GCM10028808_30210 [Spirosoma migulaei]
MPICQPIQTSISANDFRDGAYTFSVESVLESVLSPGRLIVSASAGYLLITSLTNVSRREHTFEHKQQADGRWLATGSVTVLCSNKLPTAGKIVIQNTQAESVVLTIAATSVSVKRSLVPALTVSQSKLTFSPTALGKPSFLVFTITPQQADASVTLTTDAPEFFQLASNSRPNFGPVLTVKPSTNGTFVHLRYVSNKPGMHSGQLLLHTGSDTKSIPLTAHTTGQLSGVLMLAKKPALKRLWVGLLLVLIVGSLAFAGYSNRCQYFPALCQDRIADQGNTKTDDPLLLTAISANKLDKSARTQKNRPKKTTKSSRSSSKRTMTNEPISALAPELQAVVDSRQVKKLPSTTDKDMSKPAAGRANPQTEVPSTQESELERALNYPNPN